MENKMSKKMFFSPSAAERHLPHLIMGEMSRSDRGGEKIKKAVIAHRFFIKFI